MPSRAIVRRAFTVRGLLAVRDAGGGLYPAVASTTSRPS